MNRTWENGKKPNLGPDFCLSGPKLGPKFFFEGLPLLDIVASYHCIQF